MGTRMPVKRWPCFLVAALSSTAVLADNVAGTDRLLCSTLRAVECWQDGDCADLPPGDLNVPQFVQVDLAAKRISTTPASGENRATPIRIVERAGGRIVAQGYENGRAFSLVIHEETGRASIAAASDERSVVVFAACTPAPAGK